MTKIEIKDLSILFGPEKAKAKKMVKQGGKSTLVRCINRLNEPSMGEIWLSGRNITSLSDKELLQIRRKEMAMVFQHFGLLPHRTV